MPGSQRGVIQGAVLATTTKAQRGSDMRVKERQRPGPTRVYGSSSAF